MIGVLAKASEHAVVREFFELFKTPWESFQSGGQYDVLLCSGAVPAAEATAKLVVIYAGSQLAGDPVTRTQAAEKQFRWLSHYGRQMPVYGKSLTFPGSSSQILVEKDLGEPAIHIERLGNKVVARIGYDLFSEIGALLTAGQPAVNAAIPTIELHIELLRHLILEGGLPLLEIPPVPDGFPFIACLTHDMDHPSLRLHKFDATMFGFLYRATLGSLINFVRARASSRTLLRNWASALKLPLVYLGIAKDPWHEFQCYPEIEDGVPSTFFLIPFKKYSGRTANGPAPRRRASAYAAQDIADEIQKLRTSGCEIGVHGLDSWIDAPSAEAELQQIRTAAMADAIGVRMHWLYFDEQSPAALEAGGVAYDSTVGYNETIGYRTGTTQAYMPLGAKRLLELPLHVMDTALFYPGYLNLSPSEAGERIRAILANTAEVGGVITVNWHDRSIAAERWWCDTYVELVKDLKNAGAWFATASQAVSWFRKRRAASFEGVQWTGEALTVNVAGGRETALPGLRLRVYPARESGRHSSDKRSDLFFDIPLHQAIEGPISLLNFAAPSCTA